MTTRNACRSSVLAVLMLVAPSALAAQNAPASAWRSLTIPKTAEEIRAGREIEAATTLTPVVPDFRPILPDAFERFGFSSGIGLVTGRDGALDLNGNGRIAGFDTSLNALVTLGSRGAEWYSGHLGVSSANHRVSAGFGDLVNEMHGLSRGGSVSWRGFGNRLSTIEVYKPRFMRDGRPDGIIGAYREQWIPSRHLIVQGAIASDGAGLAKTRFFTKRIDVEPYFHGDKLRRTAGAVASVDMWRGLTLGGTASVSHLPAGAREDIRQAFLRVPLRRGSSLRIEQTRTSAGGTESITYAAEAIAPIGPVQVMTRWQNRDLALPTSFARTRIAQRGLLATAAYSPSSRVHLSLQANTEWLPDGTAQLFQEGLVSAQVTKGTFVESSLAFTGRPMLDRMRARVSQELGRGLSVVTEVGRFPAFQAPVVAEERFPSRVKVFVRKTWNVSTPARGGLVTGRVLDTAGTAVSKVVVRLGRFKTNTGTMGEFVFEHVPPGEYTLAIDEDALSAEYEPIESGRQVRVYGGSRMVEDLVVAPLGTIHGQVYVDRNGNGVADPGEGIKGAVLRIDGEKLTQSHDDGRYAFHNLGPGAHSIELVAERSPDFQVEDRVPREVVLDDRAAALGSDFRVSERQRPVRMQQWQRP